MALDLSSLPVTNRKIIPVDFIDIMGHMNVMWYIHIFDHGTRNLFNRFGFGEEYIQRTGMGSFALESHIRYLAEVKLGEAVTVRSRVLDRSAKTIHFLHFMTRDHDESLAATIEVLGAHADLTRRKVTPFPPEVLVQLDALLNVHRQLPWQAPVCGFIGVRKN
ncbi:MAG TPA: 3-hydroxybutyryl-CoA dehydratase [Chloroflexi bacterium]|nr:3-hydroxybutyryl-CoA dehydratase [Chloroflexota bacterium]